MQNPKGEFELCFIVSASLLTKVCEISFTVKFKFSKDSYRKTRSNCIFRRRMYFVNSVITSFCLCKENCVLYSESQYIYCQIVLHCIHHQIFSVKMFISSTELLQKVTTFLWLGRNKFHLGLAHLLSHSITEIYFQKFK